VTAPFDQDDEPTATFVPTWDDDDAEVTDTAPDGHATAVPDGDATAVPDAGDEPEPVPRPAEVAGAEATSETAGDDPWTADEAVETTFETEVIDDPETTVEDLPAPAPFAVAQAESGPAAAAVAARDETGPGTLRPMVPEPVSEARRARPAPGPGASSGAGWAWEKLRAASGLLVLVVVAGVGLAAAIGLLVFGIAFALRRAAGG